MAQNNSQQPAAADPAPLQVEVWADTHRGKVREANEDEVYPRAGASRGPINLDPAKLASRGTLAIVADGVGGAQGGRRASEKAVEYASDSYYDGQSPDPAFNLRQAVESANHWLHDIIRRDPSMSQSATTMTAAVVQGNKLVVAHVGDSRAYVLRQGQITQITRDHTLTQEKLEAGRIRPEDVPNDPDQSTLTRSLGIGPLVQVDVYQHPVGAGDVVLLCSDGLYDELSEREIQATVGRDAPRQAVAHLIKRAVAHGGHDNVSVAIMRLGGGPQENGRLPRIIGILSALVVAALVFALAAAVLTNLDGDTPAATVVAEIGEDNPTTATQAPAVEPSTTREQATPFPAAASPTPARTLGPTSTAISVTSPEPQPTATFTRSPGGHRPLPAPATPTRQPSATAPPARPPASPILLAPEADKELHDECRFEWTWPHAALPPGQGFDLLIWSQAEHDLHQGRRADGVIAPSRQLSTTVDLDFAATIVTHGEGRYYWTAIVVNLEPYRRIGDWGETRAFVYKRSSPSGGPGESEGPVPPSDPCAGFNCQKKCCGKTHDKCSQCCPGVVCP